MNRASRIAVPVILPVILIALAACAAPAESEHMAANAPALESPFASSPFATEIAIAAVGGGEETDPMWTSEVGNGAFHEALALSLDRHGVFCPRNDLARYRLQVSLVELNQPSRGFTFNVTSYVRYKLTRSADGRVLFDELVSSAGKATIEDAFVGIERLKIANERAIQQNIARFLERLETAPRAEQPARGPATQSPAGDTAI